MTVIGKGVYPTGPVTDIRFNAIEANAVRFIVYSLEDKITISEGNYSGRSRSTVRLLEIKVFGTEKANKIDSGYVVEASGSSGTKELAPDFSVKTIDGRNLGLKSLKGKVVLLCFYQDLDMNYFVGEERFDSVRMFMRLSSILMKFQDKYSDVQVIGLLPPRDYDYFYRRNSLLSLPEIRSITYPLAISDIAIDKSYKVSRGSFPVIFVIDTEGKIMDKFNVSLFSQDFDNLEQRLEKNLALLLVQ